MRFLQLPFLAYCSLAFVLSTPAWASTFGDLNCDDAVDVIDVQVTILIAFGVSPNIPNTCSTGATCGSGTTLDVAGAECVALITQSDLDAAVAAVDITSDNESVCIAAGGTWSASGACPPDSATWNAGYGPCSTYNPGQGNHSFCNLDTDPANGGLASQACPNACGTDCSGFGPATCKASAGAFTQSDLDAAVANATAGLYTQNELDAAVANATAGLYTQSELDAAVANATAGLYTQSELDAAVATATSNCPSQETILGCTNVQACNYAPNANSDDGSCVLPTTGFDCLGNALPKVGDTAFGGMVISVDEAAGTGVVIAMEDAAPGNWNDAIVNANNFVSTVQGGPDTCTVGYLSPWRLPTQQEFLLVCQSGDMPNHVWQDQASFQDGIDGWSGWWFWTSDVDPAQATASHYGTYYEPGESPYGPDGSCKVSSSTNNNFQQSMVIRVRPFRTYSIY